MGLDLNRLRIVHDRLHDWPRGNVDIHPHPVCKVDGCNGVLFQIKPGRFFVCDVDARHLVHLKLCADAEGRVECVCGLTELITRNQQPKESPND